MLTSVGNDRKGLHTPSHNIKDLREQTGIGSTKEKVVQTRTEDCS